MKLFFAQEEAVLDVLSLKVYEGILRDIAAIDCFAFRSDLWVLTN